MYAFRSFNKTIHPSVTWPGYSPLQDMHIIHSLTHAQGQFRASRQPNVLVFGLWEETGGAGENPTRHRRNTQTPHRKTPSQEKMSLQRSLKFIFQRENLIKDKMSQLGSCYSAQICTLFGWKLRSLLQAEFLVFEINNQSKKWIFALAVVNSVNFRLF